MRYQRRGRYRRSPLQLIIQDTAADPARAESAVEELAGLGVAALAGEYHSVAARAIAAKADALGLPYLCSSAVLDSLTDQATNWVARLSPPQSRGWRIYADFLLAAGHSHIAVTTQPSVYWASGIRILREYFDRTVVPLSNWTCDRSPPRRCATNSLRAARQRSFSWSDTRSRQSRS